MNKVEAKELLSDFIEYLREKPYAELQQLISNPICLEVEGASGTPYQLEYEALWDSEPNGLLRVMASIDDGGFMTAMFPLSQSFLVDSESSVMN